MIKQPLTILDRYIIKKFIGSFLIVIAMIIVVVVVVDVAENIQDFLDNKVPVMEIVTGYYLNFIPYFVNLFSPLFTFVAVIYFTSKLSRNSEIIAMLNAGMSFYRLMVPYIISAVFIGILSFYLTNFLIPQTQRGMMKYKEKYMSSMQVRSKDIDNHIKTAPNTYAYVHYWDNANNLGYNFWYEFMGDDGILYKLHAQTIAWDTVTHIWRLNNYIRRTFDKGKETLEYGDRKDTMLNISISDFVWVKEGYTMMNYSEIREFIAEEKEKGSVEIRNYEFEKHRRLAFPFATIILSVVGLCVSSRKSKQGVGLHLLLGLLLTFSFIMLLQVSQVFAIYGGLSPAWAAWTPNILYSLLCVVLVKNTPK
ncbi:MAG: LptF/LptG family permease [Bacteroidales bacterium]|jgi:lipopolysaccharide export system permease protein|nr:LptF/LptG family permease [Bacteroidales bacterium]